MEKVAQKAGLTVTAFVLLFGIYYFIAYHVTAEQYYKMQTYQVLGSETVGDYNSGTEQVYSIRLNGITQENRHLMFYTIHQNVSVFYGYKCLYSMRASKKNPFSKTPGCVWNDVVLSEELNDREIRVVLSSVYEELKYAAPTFYLGQSAQITFDLAKTEFFPITISVILIFAGCVFIGYVFYNHKNSEVDKNLVLLGVFSVMTGIWKITDSTAIKVIFPGYPVLSMIPFAAMLLTQIPCILFLKELHMSKDRRVWYIPCWINIIVCAASLFLQYFNIKDFREVLLLILGSMFVNLGTILYMVFLELRQNGWNPKLKKNLAGFSLMIFGFFLDIATYYFSGGRQTSSYGILGFLIYTILLGAMIFHESGALMVAGEEAEGYVNIALHDELTGLNNRSAFLLDTDPYSVTPDDYTVVVMDLNDLKKTNDTLGHDRGDQYLRDSAKIIQDTFGTIGSCYRMGGDEFYCLIPTGGRTACREQKERMDQMIREYNEKASDIHMAIACGFTRYDKRMDYDLRATAKRADQLMYKDKEQLKQARSAEDNRNGQA
ncbi:MAG: GGDEF domain-containing protein [Lachnospiraceae bacterium]|nr:GGDEF domain-containing protein [Lachnospiraceae bacterium]